MGTQEDLILAIDVGTTNCRAAIINKSGEIKNIAYKPIELLSPRKGWFEICPHVLWSTILELIKVVIKDNEEKVRTCGISVQRNTFITWRKDTGTYLHNFITWLDMRSTSMCESWNNNCLINFGRWIAWALGCVVRSRHMICAASFNVKEKAIPMRLKWVIDNIPNAKELQKDNNMCFGTIETWLVWKLTNGKVWATDYSCASSTGIFDIWKLTWCPIMTTLFGNPMNILPEVRCSNAFFGMIDESLELGFSVPITGVIGDQQASIFGNQLFDVGDLKLTLGTGIACNINTGSKTHPTSHDIFPLIGWKLENEDVFYVAEVIAANGGRAVEWTVTSGLIDQITEVDKIAKSVPDSGGVSFIPAFNGMEVPYRDPFAGTSLFGISLSTKTKSIVRAVLESQIFISKHVLDMVFNFYGKPQTIRVDGGASRSSFIVENIVQLSRTRIERSDCVEESLMGAAFLAALGVGMYGSFSDIKSYVPLKMSMFDTKNTSLDDDEKLFKSYEVWCQSAQRCVQWHNRNR